MQIVNLNNGERVETYVIKGRRGSRISGLNGAAARMGEIKDQIFIISYALIDPKKEEVNPNNPNYGLKEHYIFIYFCCKSALFS